MRSFSFVASAALAAGFQLLSSSASAHIELESPMNRYSDIRRGDNKACPCGSGTTNRRCNKPDELSDPDRSEDRITTFAPGDTITVRWEEYVGHSGRYRIAFDPDGADLDDFNQNILLDEPDPSGKVGNTGEGSFWEFEVKLPDMECENCTLQLIQVMDGNTTDPVLNPVDRGGTYFQCADIRLAEGTPAGGIAPENPSEHLGLRASPNTATGTSSSSSTGMTGTGSTSTSGMVSDTGSDRGAASGMTMNSDTGADDMLDPSMDMESSAGGAGCSVGAARSQRTGSAIAALGCALVGLALNARRQRR